jgi:hypothetical protein
VPPLIELIAEMTQAVVEPRIAEPVVDIPVERAIVRPIVAVAANPRRGTADLADDTTPLSCLILRIKGTYFP